MATPKKPLRTEAVAANSPHHEGSPTELKDEYQQRRQSKRPLPASVARAYEVLIARQELG